jgi:hypothetical protein
MNDVAGNAGRTVTGSGAAIANVSSALSPRRSRAFSLTNTTPTVLNVPTIRFPCTVKSSAAGLKVTS